MNPDPSRRSVQRWYDPKKNVRFGITGPPSVPPNWFSTRYGESVRPAALSWLFREFSLSSLWKMNADPRKSLVPFLVITFITDPAARPNSAANWFVMSRISWTMSVLLIGCWRPVTLGSLLS